MERFHAASGDDLNRIQELVTSEDVNLRNERGATALHCACGRGSERVAEWLVAIGANVNNRTSEGKTALHFATERSRAACVKLLLAAGADASIADIEGCLPLHYAQSEECAALLISAHPSGASAADKKRRTPLHVAAEKGNVRVSRLLLDVSSVVEAADVRGYTPLVEAVWRERRDVVELLLDRGAQLNPVGPLWGPWGAPQWAVDMASIAPCRIACRSSCLVMMGLRGCQSGVIGSNNRDVLRLVARLVWSTRLRDPGWAKSENRAPEQSKVKNCNLC